MAAGLVLAKMVVQADVSAGMAIVDVEQAFHHSYQQPVDVLYTFPLPPSAAVREMQVRCGDRTLEATIRPREEARATYQQARQTGRRAALVEQQRPNQFVQHIAGVCPGEDLTVALQYVAEVTYTEQRYQLALPMASGERYAAAVGDVEAPRVARLPADTEVTVVLRDGPIRELASPSHALTVEERAGGTWVSVDSVVRDRDVVLDWALASDPSGLTGIVDPPRGDEPGTVVLTVEPRPTRVAHRKPRELVFLVDASCSMSGRPWTIARQAVERALDDMQAGDTFDLVAFSSEAQPLFPVPVANTPENRARAASWLAVRTDHGGTEMENGLEAALQLPGSGHAQRFVLLLTDGYIGREESVFDLVERHRGAHRVFALGIGSSVNRYLLEGVARAGGGTTTVHLPDQPVEDALDRFYRQVDQEPLLDVQIDWGGLDMFDVVPERLPALFVGEPLQVAARFRDPDVDGVWVRLTGTVGEQRYEQIRWLSLDSTVPAEGARVVWARRRIRALGSVPTLTEDARAKAITDLAVRHRLVSPHTSLVAVSDAPSPCGSARMVMSVPEVQPYATRPVEGSSSSGRTIIDFEGVDVSGELVKPQGQLLQDRRRARFNPLIALRREFEPELPWGSADVDALTVAPGAVWEAPPASEALEESVRHWLTRARGCRGADRTELTVWVLRGRAVGLLVHSADPHLVQCITADARRGRFDPDLQQVGRVSPLPADVERYRHPVLW